MTEDGEAIRVQLVRVADALEGIVGFLNKLESPTATPQVDPVATDRPPRDVYNPREKM